MVELGDLTRHYGFAYYSEWSLVLGGWLEGGPAGKAGVQKGDVLVKVGDLPVQTSLDVQRGRLEREAGQSVDVEGERDGEKKSITLALESAPRNDNRAAASLAHSST